MGNKRIEGIFDVEDKSDGYAQIEERVAIGLIKGIRDYEETVKTTAIYADDKKKIKGVYLKIRNNRGEAEVKLPVEISLGERANLLNQEVKYLYHQWSSAAEGTSEDYELRILGGSSKGQILTRNVFV